MNRTRKDTCARTHEEDRNSLRSNRNMKAHGNKRDIADFRSISQYKIEIMLMLETICKIRF
jgi:hypothetical protein